MVPHARVCSECGNWVVGAHATAEPVPPSVVAASRMPPGPGSRMPPAPSVVPPPASHYAPMPPAPLPTPTVQQSVPPPMQLGPMPPPPPVQLPDAPELAGTLPASALSLGVLIALPDPIDQTQKTGRRPIGASTEIRTTVDTGRPPPNEPLRTASRMIDEVPTASRAAKTIVDERPPVAPSRSIGRTPRPLGGFLVSYQYEPLGTFWPLAVGTNIVGRSGGSRADLDVGIADTTVSSEQALLEVDAGAVTVEDRGSRNGTQVNGRAVVPGVRVPLAQGDRVRFGSFETILVLVPYPGGV